MKTAANTQHGIIYIEITIEITGTEPFMQNLTQKCQVSNQMSMRKMYMKSICRHIASLKSINIFLEMLTLLRTA